MKHLLVPQHMQEMKMSETKIVPYVDGFHYRIRPRVVYEILRYENDEFLWVEDMLYGRLYTELDVKKKTVMECKELIKEVIKNMLKNDDSIKVDVRVDMK